jgi:hypothetical protein
MIYVGFFAGKARPLLRVTLFVGYPALAAGRML